jgi:predicted glycosyltransferase involved in capsule biosynthesis
MLDLSKTTLIIPIRVEHKDRYRNSEVILNFLNSNFYTNVFIFETSSNGETRLDFLESLENLNIKHWCIPEEDSFHRTKYLNIMLDEVETPVVINYDIDVLLDPQNFLECQNDILEGKSKVIYPYELGNGQIMVLESFDYEGFKNSNYSMEFLNSSPNIREFIAECGHCMFFNTHEYKLWGGENEDFISYGPEDKERLYRFQKLTNSVSWREGEKVYHLEHYRGNDSASSNPHFNQNWKVFESIKSMDISSLSNHYKNIWYSEKYKTFCKNQEVSQ